MAKFAKVFDLDNDEQVLVTLEFQETENSEEAQLKVFHGYSKKDALEFREATVKMFS